MIRSGNEVRLGFGAKIDEFGILIPAEIRG
jgi:hypothetical protein